MYFANHMTTTWPKPLNHELSARVQGSPRATHVWGRHVWGWIRSPSALRPAKSVWSSTPWWVSLIWFSDGNFGVALHSQIFWPLYMHSHAHTHTHTHTPPPPPSTQPSPSHTQTRIPMLQRRCKPPRECKYRFVLNWVEHACFVVVFVFINYFASMFKVVCTTVNYLIIP